MHRRKILLLSYKFPPYPGVGGNRWMNLTNYLADFGCDVHVVTVKWATGNDSPWADYQPPDNVFIHAIPSGYPHNMRHRKIRNFYLERLRALFFSKYILGQIWWDDEAQYWGFYLMPACRRIVAEHGVEVVIATGHPFEVNYWATKVANDLKLPLIQDLRDPWIDNPFAQYSEKKRQKLAARVKSVLISCDRVVFVTEDLMEVYRNHFDFGLKGVVIANGHNIIANSSAQYPSKEVCIRPTNVVKVKMIYLGSIGNGRDEPFDCFLTGIEKLYKETGIRVIIDIYGLEGPKTLRRFAQYIEKGYVIFKNAIPQQEIFSTLRQYAAALQLNARAFPFLVSTKLFEYAAAKIPTISVNYGGAIEKLIDELDCGFSINLLKNDIVESLRSIILKLDTPFSFRVDKYHWRSLAGQYFDLINEVVNSGTIRHP